MQHTERNVLRFVAALMPRRNAAHKAAAPVTRSIAAAAAATSEQTPAAAPRAWETELNSAAALLEKVGIEMGIGQQLRASQQFGRSAAVEK